MIVDDQFSVVQIVCIPKAICMDRQPRQGNTVMIHIDKDSLHACMTCHMSDQDRVQMLASLSCTEANMVTDNLHGHLSWSYLGTHMIMCEINS